ncbi:hypothetical protein [Heyndrickxia oleronia]|uniref:ABC transporter permease n=1 Tax=Heyndrickxia oleronia TaxID=38875 RepID=A0AAW6SVE6_9BACI|nr:hypothetical protein [Heyndrickxia oleronia]MDH5160837.1 hypothetical protein [Heyndrickxia oleronia]
MEDFRTLKILDRFQGLFEKMGVDYSILRKILKVKLMMDQRRVPTIFSQSSKKKKDNNKQETNGFIKSLWIYAFIGLFTIPFIVFGTNYMFQMSIVFGIVMFMVMTSMISDFSSVLLDVRDKNILHTKQINRKTISIAKFVHICIYLVLLTTSITAIPMIVGLFRHGIVFFIISIIGLILTNLLIVVFTALLYIFVLKFFDGEKLKDIINYVQIGLSLALMVGYQVLIRSFEIFDFDFVLHPHWWHIFIFPMWYAAPYEWIINGQSSMFYIVFSLLAIMVPLIAFWIYLRLVPAFEKNLQKLSNQSKSKLIKRRGWKEWLLSCICRSKEERAFYRFTTLMMKHERDFKLKVYPSLGFSFVIPFIFIFTTMNHRGFNQAGSKSYLTIYFSMLIIPTVVMMLRYSGKYKGAWIFKTLPIKDYSLLFKGTLKAFLVKLYLPIYLVLSFIFIIIFGIKIVPDLIIILINSFLYTMISFLFLEKSIPFSESFETIGQSEGWKIFVLFIPIALLAGIHYVSLQVPIGIYINIVISFITSLILWKIGLRKVRI